MCDCFMQFFFVIVPVGTCLFYVWWIKLKLRELKMIVWSRWWVPFFYMKIDMQKLWNFLFQNDRRGFGKWKNLWPVLCKFISQALNKEGWMQMIAKNIFLKVLKFYVDLKIFFMGIKMKNFCEIQCNAEVLARWSWIFWGIECAKNFMDYLNVEDFIKIEGEFILQY